MKKWSASFNIDAEHVYPSLHKKTKFSAKDLFSKSEQIR